MLKERLELVKNNKSKPWTLKNLETVLRYLKKGKSRDPNAHANEIYHIEAAGDDLKCALLVIMNKIKEQLTYPQIFLHSTKRAEEMILEIIVVYSD